jgi:hypothetical protein
MNYNKTLTTLSGFALLLLLCTSCMSSKPNKAPILEGSRIEGEASGSLSAPVQLP